ncbi:MAG TPA: TrbG/VirB9 family P-type conjugative transfer protein, partial [Thermoanaerobaculia bacterium]|nr:TrbG/VirB9 family P-type conjugative transfer protein [Thermoanaerobaculia bacterium]
MTWTSWTRWRFAAWTVAGLALYALVGGVAGGVRPAAGAEPPAGGGSLGADREALAAALPGEPTDGGGATGATGATSAAGAPGAPGATGATGASGAAGAGGASGAGGAGGATGAAGAMGAMGAMEATGGSEAKGASGESRATVPVAADVEREARAVAAGREPAVLEHGDFVQVPFGHQVPVVRCAPLRVCLIELEEGELVLNTVTGDAARWILDRAEAGPRGRTTVIVAKPTACNLTTNLVITTNRRIYQITLDARPCKSEEGENPHEAFTRLLRFYYPDELVRSWASAEEVKRAAAAEEARAVTPLGTGSGGLAVG